jgi:hypothetical protein
MTFEDAIILDRVDGTTIPRHILNVQNLHALDVEVEGLHYLAQLVFDFERQKAARSPGPNCQVFELMPQVPTLVVSAFNWFSVSLVNYLQLIFYCKHLSSDRTNQKAMDAKNLNEMKIYVRSVANEVFEWRNKVAAHYSATSPKNDSIATQRQSLMNPITFSGNRFFVGQYQLSSLDKTSELPCWSLTQVFEELSPRFWPGRSLREA